MIKIWFDFTCPYCYSGLIKLLNAKKKLQRKISIEFHSFLLNPEIRNKESFREHLIRTYNFSEDELREKYNSVKLTLSEVGININPDDISVVSTLFAHQILTLINNDIKTDYILAVMNAHFVELKDISKMDTLMDILKNIGVDIPKIDIDITNKKIANDRKLAQDIWFDYVPYISIDEKSIQGDFKFEDLLEIL